MRALIVLGAALLVGAAALALFGGPVIVWADAQQKALQAELARALVAVRGGDPVAIGTVIGVCGLYGVVHAVGPGHGKLLIGGAALASRRTARRMAGLGLAASLAQGATAIVLVFGALGLFALASRSVVSLSEGALTAASYGAMAAIGGWILWRGVRSARDLWRDDRRRHHAHHGGCAGGCRHAPTVQETEKAETWRDAAALIASIGVRPCSGALIVLALAWRFETQLVGVLSVIAMALGTGLVVAAVALTAVRLRDAGGLTDVGTGGRWSFAAVQLVVGGAILAISSTLAVAAIDQGDRAHPLMQAAGDRADDPGAWR